MELFTYHHPKGDQTIHRRKTNDLGGIRHVAVEVPDAVAAHAFIRVQQQAYRRRGLDIEILGQDHIPEELTPFPYKFFYWIDPWGVQWEMELAFAGLHQLCAPLLDRLKVLPGPQRQALRTALICA